MSDTSDSVRIPRIRTVKGLLAEFRKLDPDTAVNERMIRDALKSGKVPVFRAGKKLLADFDKTLAYFQCELPDDEDEPDIHPVSGIRPVTV